MDSFGTRIFLLLTFISLTFKSGSSWPYPDKAKHHFKRDTFYSNPILNNVFRNRNPELSLMDKFFGDDNSAFEIIRSGNYIVRVPVANNKNFEREPGKSADHHTNKKQLDSSIYNFDRGFEELGQAFAVKDENKVPDKPVALTAISEDFSDVNKNNGSPTKKTIECQSRFQSELANGEQKMLKYFSNLVEYRSNPNENRLKNPCVPFSDLKETKTKDIQKNITEDQDSVTLSNKNQEQSKEQTNEDRKPAPLDKQPNTLLLDEETRKSFFNSKIEEEKKNIYDIDWRKNSKNNDKVVPDKTFPSPILSYIHESPAKDNLKLSGKGNQQVNRGNYKGDQVNLFSSQEKNSTAKPQPESGVSVNINENTLTAVTEVATAKPSSFQLPEGVEVTKLPIQKSPKPIRGQNNAIKIKTVAEKTNPTNELNKIAEDFRRRQNNLTNEEIQNLSEAILRIWNPLNPVPENSKPNNNKNNSNRQKTVVKNPARKRKNQVSTKPPRGSDEEDVLTSILSRVTQAILSSSIERSRTSPRRTRRDVVPRFKGNVYRILAKNNAKKYIAPKHFPKSGKNVFFLPSAVKALTHDFLRKNDESIQDNMIDSETDKEKVLTLADIFNSDYPRGGRNKKSRVYLEDFDQIM